MRKGQEGGAYSALSPPAGDPGWYTLPMPVVNHPAFLKAPGKEETALPSTSRNDPLKFQI